MTKYNWEKIKSEYVEGIRDEEGNVRYPTLRELSEKYGPNYNHLAKKAWEDKWTQERKLYTKKIQTLRQEKKSEILASEAAEFDSKTLELAKAGLNLIKAIFSQVVKKMKQEGFIDKEDIEGLDRALVNYQKAGKLALGEPTNREEITGDIVSLFKRKNKS